MSEIGYFRKAKHQYFGRHQNSPLTPAQQKGFQRLEYFPENPALQFVLVVEEFPDDSRDLIQMATSSGDTAPHTRWGQSKFEVDEESVALTVYRSVDGDDFPLAGEDTSRSNAGTGQLMPLGWQRATI